MNDKKNTPRIMVELLSNKEEDKKYGVDKTTSANATVHGTANDIVAMLVCLGDTLNNTNVPKKLALASLLAGLNHKQGEEVDVDPENFVMDIMALLLDL